MNGRLDLAVILRRERCLGWCIQPGAEPCRAAPSPERGPSRDGVLRSQLSSLPRASDRSWVPGPFKDWPAPPLPTASSAPNRRCCPGRTSPLGCRPSPWMSSRPLPTPTARGPAGRTATSRTSEAGAASSVRRRWRTGASTRTARWRSTMGRGAAAGSPWPTRTAAGPTAPRAGGRRTTRTCRAWWAARRGPRPSTTTRSAGPGWSGRCGQRAPAAAAASRRRRSWAHRSALAAPPTTPGRRRPPTRRARLRTTRRTRPTTRCLPTASSSSAGARPTAAATCPTTATRRRRGRRRHPRRRRWGPGGLPGGRWARSPTGGRGLGRKANRAGGPCPRCADARWGPGGESRLSCLGNPDVRLVCPPPPSTQVGPGEVTGLGAQSVENKQK